jgi:flagellin
MAVREMMRGDIAVLQQGARNALDGISLLQTMEGAVAVIDSALVRMKQLAEQAATGSYSSAQRAIMDNEFSQMAEEIDHIADATDFNGVYMLNNSAAVSIHFGDESDPIDLAGSNMTTSALGIDSLVITTAAGADAALTTLTSAITLKDSARASFGYMMNRLESTRQVLDIQAENLMAAESRISDVDVATEMATLTRNQVLAQAGIAMLAQANSIPTMALTLLR